jgi:hypothetical protein
VVEIQTSDGEVINTNANARVQTKMATFVPYSQGITADPSATASAALSFSSETSEVQALGSTSAVAAALLDLSATSGAQAANSTAASTVALTSSSETSAALMSGDNSQNEQIADLLQQAKCNAIDERCFLWPGCWSPNTQNDNTPGAKDIPYRYHAVGIADRYDWDFYLKDESIPETDYLDFITRLEEDTILKEFIAAALSYKTGHQNKDLVANFLYSLRRGSGYKTATDKRGDCKRQALTSFSNVIKDLFENTHSGDITTSEWMSTFNEAIRVKKQSKGGGGGGGIKGTATTGSSKKGGGRRNSGGKAAAKKDGSGKGGGSDSQTPPSTAGNNNSGSGSSSSPPSTTTSTAISAPASGTPVKVNRSQLTTLDDADIVNHLPTLSNAINDAFKTELQGEDLENAVQQLVPSLKKFTEDIYSQKLDELAGSASEIIIDLTEEV